MKLNNYFDTSKPILQNIIDYCIANDGRISDSLFDQCIDEFKADETKVMDEMIAEKDRGRFERENDGFVFFEK